MKQGKTLQELAQELDARASVKQDYIANTSELKTELIGEDSRELVMHVPGNGVYAPTDHAHGQIATKLSIPKRYYDRMRSEAPDLLKNNIDHWLEDQDDRRMIRTMGTDMRAFLSDRYRRIENEQVAQMVMPILYDHPAKPYPLSMEVTDRKLYMKFLFQGFEADINGRTIHPGISISNSEIGAGRLDIQGFFYDDYCTNGCVFGSRNNDLSLKRNHLGRVLESDDYHIISDETRALEDQTILSMTRDVVTAAGSEQVFNRMLSDLQALTEGPRVEHPQEAIVALQRAVGLTEAESGSALETLIQDRDYSRWGVLSAVTSIANRDDVSYDRASELEHIGAKLLTMDLRAWTPILEAA